MNTLKKFILAVFIVNLLSGCALFLAGGAGYVVGRELEEKQNKDETEVYK